MELELESGGGGSRAVSLAVDSPTADLGRGDLGGDGGGPSADRTISRRHVSLRLLDEGGEPGVAFEVVGRNPVVVRSPNGGSSVVFRRGEKGDLRPGDALSLSLKAPAFWVVRRREGNGEGDAEVEVEAAVLDAVARREKRTRERKERESEKRAAEEEAVEVTEEEEGAAGSDVEGLDIDLASIDPVREFGFLSMGHEFDSYPKGRIRAPKDWNWFLEETKRSSDDEDDEVSNRRGRSKALGRKKKNKDGEGDDEDWTDESEDGKESLARGPSVKRSKYVTRSKDPKKPRQENSKVKGGDNDDEDEEDEEDETLGGFVVNDEDDEPMEELSDEEEEEEEFDDEEDDD
ncbi:hypothetical protein SEVIR_4G250100v4 [Setaria viridis]|uniref:FHA domain-containing protein n=1 Tax=Setaria viridis TaxID=4556 RepID=A0A4U6V5M4_SETVI|nr:sodium/potassium/calcium exchanger 1 [Setaria viridis]TKW22773.1 hypothetical protein SEVIR_4G250100v2 [Setaria viridis]